MYTVKLTTGETFICKDVWQDFNEFRLSVVDKGGDYDLCCSIEEVESVIPDEESLAKTKEELKKAILKATQQEEVYEVCMIDLERPSPVSKEEFYLDTIDNLIKELEKYETVVVVHGEALDNFRACREKREPYVEQ